MNNSNVAVARAGGVVTIAGPGQRLGRRTGIIRPIVKGDLFLSNVINMGFRAHDDSTVCYEILEECDCRRSTDRSGGTG